MIRFDLRNFHRSVHMPQMEGQVRQDGNDIVFSLSAYAMDGVVQQWPPIWERRFTVDELRQIWERAHIQGHMRTDQATAVREDAINIAQWGRDYGVPKK